MTVFDSTHLDKEDTIRLNTICDENKGKYFSVLDEFYEKYGVDPFWWFLPLISRNENYDDTLYRICLMILIVEKISSGEYEKVITDREDIKRTVDRFCKTKEYDVQTELINHSSETMFTRFLRSLEAFLYRVQSRIKAAFVERSLISQKAGGCDILVWGPLLLNKIKGKEYDDGYYPGLNGLCDKNFCYYPYLIYNTDDNWKTIISKVNGIGTYKFIHMRGYHRWYDLFFCLEYRRYCRKLLKNSYRFDDYDITPIICATIVKEIHQRNYYYALYYYLATKRLVQKIPIRKIILWYEARPVDIAISLAIRESGRDIKRVGYIGYPLAECMFGQSPIKSQVTNSVVPEIISVPGRVYERIIKQYAPFQKTIIVPAFRVNTQRIKKHSYNRSKVFFLVLSYYPDISREMIRIVNEYCKRLSDISFRIRVKMHPTFAGKKIDEFYDDTLYFNPEYSDSNIYDCLEDVDVAFTALSSSSMDVILSGAYLICMCRKGRFYYTSVAPGINTNRYSIVFDDDDFERAMKKYTLQNKSDDFSILNAEDYFVSVNKQNCRELFE